MLGQQLAVGFFELRYFQTVSLDRVQGFGKTGSGSSPPLSYDVEQSCHEIGGRQAYAPVRPRNLLSLRLGCVNEEIGT